MVAGIACVAIARGGCVCAEDNANGQLKQRVTRAGKPNTQRSTRGGGKWQVYHCSFSLYPTLALKASELGGALFPKIEAPLSVNQTD